VVALNNPTEEKMKLNLLAALACLLACGSVSAAPKACVNGTLADYIALGAQGCILNGDVFANFSYAAGAERWRSDDHGGSDFAYSLPDRRLGRVA
jgi:hypothetical protein